MTALVLDGKGLAAGIRAALRPRVDALAAAGRRPGLAVVLVGDDPASAVYVRNKVRACEEAGIASTLHRLPATTPAAALRELIGTLNDHPAVHGILLQLPLPAPLDADALVAAIRPDKDVDGLHAENAGLTLMGRPRFRSCTPYGVMRLLESAGIDPAGRHAVVVGRSNMVGKPMAMLLLAAHATVTICHSRTRGLAELTRQAEILVVAAGRPGLVGAAHVHPGATVIDVGIHRGDDGRLRGDVDFDPVREVAGAITPVPGGVGPMTIAMLLTNTVEAAERAAASAAPH